MERESKKGFLLYYDYRNHLAILTDEERGKLFMALLDYSETHTAPNLDGAALMAFSFITAQMDRDAKAYEKTVKARREAGKKGGRPAKTSSTDDEEPEPNESNESEEKQTKAKKAKGFQEKQTKAKKTDTDTDTDTVTDTVTVITTPLPPSGGKAAPDVAAEAVEDAPPTPYKEIVALYHEICKTFQPLRAITLKRKQAMDECWEKSEYSLDTFRELFTKAEASPLLKGKNKSGWMADFNWLMDIDHMANTLENKYVDREQPQAGSSFDANEFFAAAVRYGRREPEMSRPAEPPKTAADDESIRRRGEELRALLHEGA